jgi:hypothetical protein
MRKIILFVFIFVFLFNIVDAKTFEEDNKFYVEQNLVGGWNLIAGISFEGVHKNSELGLDAIFSSYYYNAKNKENVNIRPKYEAREIAPLILYANAFWVFSAKSGKIIYRVSPSFVDNKYIENYYPFYKGENLIAINDKMYGKTINEIKGNCKIRNVYFYDSEWIKIELNQKIDFKERDVLTGRGINVVVEDDCNFMKSDINIDKTKDEEDSNSVRGSSGSTVFYTRIIPTYKDLKELKILNQKLAPKEKVKLKVSNEVHYVGVIEIKSNIVVVEIESNPLVRELKYGETIKADLGNDGIYDLYVKLNSISSGKADLTIGYLSEAIPQEKKEDKISDVREKIIYDFVPQNPPEEVKDKSYLLWIIITILAILIIIVLIVLLISRRKSKLNVQVEEIKKL